MSRAARSARFSLNGFQLRCAGPEPVNPTMSMRTGNRAPGPLLRRSYCGGSHTARRRTCGSPSGLSASTFERYSSITIVPAPRTGRLRAMRCFLWLLPVADFDKGEELAAGPRIAAEGAEHVAGDHRDAALVDASRCHAFVHGLDHDADAARFQHRVDAGGDLCSHLLLHLEPTRIGIDYPRQLADPDHLVGGQVTHMGAADDRRHVMLAVRFELDVAEHDHLVVAGGLLEGATQILTWIDTVAAVPVAIGSYDTARRVAQTLAGGILAGPAQQDAHRIFRGCMVDGLFDRLLRLRHSRLPFQRRAWPRQSISSRNPATIPPRCAKCATPWLVPVTPRYSSSRP